MAGPVDFARLRWLTDPVTSGLTASRWALKKGMRAAVAIASPVLGRFAGARSGHAPRVLTYHRVREAVREPFSVPPAALAEQMAWLESEGRVISADDLARFVAGESPPRPGSVLVTFDDGYRDFHAEALPILRRHRIPAVLFVSVGAVTDRRDCGAEADAHVTWGELAEIRDAGISVASHGWDHVSLARIPDAEAGRQVAAARDLLRRRLGDSAGVDFAYPYGTGGDFGRDTRAAVAAAGYRCAFTSVHGAIAPGLDPLELPRDKVEGGEGMWMFRRIVGGGLDSWSLVDRGLWRWQAERRVVTEAGSEA